MNRIMKAGNYHEKEYQVTVNKPVTEEFIRGMGGGVPILDTVTRPCKVTKTGKNSFQYHPYPGSEPPDPSYV